MEGWEEKGAGSIGRRDGTKSKVNEENEGKQ